MSAHDRRTKSCGGASSDGLCNLTLEQVLVIDRALGSVGAFGEVRIVKAKGRVRFIETLESRDMLKIGNGAKVGNGRSMGNGREDP